MKCPTCDSGHYTSTAVTSLLYQFRCQNCGTVFTAEMVLRAENAELKRKVEKLEAVAKAAQWIADAYNKGQLQNIPRRVVRLVDVMRDAGEGEK